MSIYRIYVNLITFDPSEALSIYLERGFTSGWLNLSQSIDRMALTKYVPCITPRGEFFNITAFRYMTGDPLFVLLVFFPNIIQQF